jgi:hypothetical protein
LARRGMGDRSRDRRRRGALASRLLWCRRRLRARSYRELRSARFARRRRSTHRVLEFSKIGPRLRRALHLWTDARMGGRKRPISTVTSPSKDMRNCGRCSAAHHAASRAQSLQHVLQENSDTARPEGRDRGRGASDLWIGGRYGWSTRRHQNS